jgi:arginyl-tRNA--protein-N-Asp/Glu arginylyltransferase
VFFNGNLRFIDLYLTEEGQTIFS